MDNQKVLIVGITGQDGSYLAETALERGHEVHGIVRKASNFNTDRLEGILDHERLRLHYGDLTDGTNLSKLIREIKPDILFNMGAQSHVHVSFQVPEYSANTDGLGVLRVLDAIKTYCPECKVLQASTSEMFGKIRETPQNEKTPFYPRSPYAVSKVFGYWIVINYREAYNIFASNAITFNHESTRRLETFVTRKITKAVAKIKHGLQETLYLGNLSAQRDWSYAPEIIEGFWKIIEYKTAEDFVLASGEMHSVEEFCEQAFKIAEIPIKFSGYGVDRKGVDEKGKVRVSVDPRYFRPTEVDSLLGDYSKARNLLGWEPKTGFYELVKLMTNYDLNLIGK